MPKLLIERTGQKNDTDPVKDARLLKPGCVIWVYPDDWQFSVEERNNPNWTIASTALPMEEAWELVEEEDGDLLLNPLLQIRKFKLDFNEMPSGIAAKLRASRAVERDPIEIGANAMRKAKKAIPARANPLVAR